MTDVEHERYLLDRPQRLGILPTWWWWFRNDRENLRLIEWPLTVVSTGLALGVFFLPTFGGLALLTSQVLLLGCVEKYIRHEALKRRALAEAAEAPEAPPHPAPR